MSTGHMCTKIWALAYEILFEAISGESIRATCLLKSLRVMQHSTCALMHFLSFKFWCLIKVCGLDELMCMCSNVSQLHTAAMKLMFWFCANSGPIKRAVQSLFLSSQYLSTYCALPESDCIFTSILFRDKVLKFRNSAPFMFVLDWYFCVCHNWAYRKWFRMSRSLRLRNSTDPAQNNTAIEIGCSSA